MNMMGQSIEGVQDSEFFTAVLASCASPLSGVITGACFTAVIQSSAATTAMLQMLAQKGSISITSAFYIILGANIGTCATAALASVNVKATAKKVTLIHLLFNTAGTIIFLAVLAFVPIGEYLELWFPENAKLQIAAVNIVFNAVSAIAVLPLPVKRISRAWKKVKTRKFHSHNLQNGYGFTAEI